MTPLSRSLDIVTVIGINILIIKLEIHACRNISPSFPNSEMVANVLERCIYNRLVDHIQKMLSDEQHGFLRGKSCVGQLLSVLDNNRMLGMLKRSTVHVRDASTRRSLYLALVRSHLAYASQVWSPQTVSMCGELANVQRRATKFVLALPFETDTRYKSRLLALNLLPLSHWHEYMDVLLLFKLTRGFISSDLNILPEQNNKLRMNLRSQNTTLVIYHIPKTKTLCYQNSYVVRASRIWNTLHGYGTLFPMNYNYQRFHTIDLNPSFPNITLLPPRPPSAKITPSHGKQYVPSAIKQDH